MCWWIQGDSIIPNNNFSNTYIEDDYLDPSLLNDPMEGGNSGLDPYKISTRIDWDENDCSDYPPDQNVKDAEGKCVCEGVEPPS